MTDAAEPANRTASAPAPAPAAAAPAPAPARAPAVAYVAGLFPVASETFVQREVRELRRRGWTVHTVALNRSPDAGSPELRDLADQTHVLYANRGALVASALAELATHPLRSARTVGRAIADAIAPGEPTSIASRLKLIGQSIAALALARHLRTLGVRHVHCHFAHAPATVGMYAAGQLGVPFSFTGHANDLFQRRALLRRKLRRAAFVSCISDWHRGFYSAILPPRDAKHYTIVRCGVDTAGWRPTGPSAVAASKTFRVVTVCRLVEKKGVDTLIRSVAQLHKAGVNVELTVAGDGPERDRLHGLAQELGCAAVVRFLGAVPNERVRELLAEADVFALPCRTDARGDRDGIPVVLMEAMACGLPAISGDLPAIRELIADNQTGLLVNGTAEAQLGQHLATLATDAAARARLGAAGRRRVEQEFGLDANVSRLEAALRGAGAAAGET